MEIPMLSSFIEGLKLFFASKRMKWFTLVFFFGVTLSIVWEQIGIFVPAIAGVGLAFSVFPVYFMLLAFLSLLGLQRFLADEETYTRSIILTIVWMVVSAVVLIMMIILVFPLLFFIMFYVGFLGWIFFQSFLSSRTALRYAEKVDFGHRSKLSAVLFAFGNIFNYVVIIGAFIVTALFINPLSLGTPAMGFAAVGLVLALGFNFLNGVILTWNRNKPSADNIALLGLFISLYSAYFIYNVLKGFTDTIDFVGIAISVFFILYTMSSVGTILSSRAESESRFKLTKEFAASLTFFLAASYVFVDVFLSFIADPSLQGAAGDAYKLIVFPFVALVMEILFVIRTRRVTKVPETPEEMPIVPVEEVVYEDGEEVERYTPGEEETSPEQEETEPEVIEEEPVTEDLESVSEEPSEDYSDE
ncbi:MAG: hypothetical protein ACXAEF_13350 [Candidatus Thorarchaeota archaeon]|jgi:hypothetical protein